MKLPKDVIERITNYEPFGLRLALDYAAKDYAVFPL